MFKALFVNWKTTLAGLAEGIVSGTIAHHVSQGMTWGQAFWTTVATVGPMVRGMLSKDHDVTGGTKGQ